MSQVHAIACVLPFCQGTQARQTNLSIGLRITAIALGIIAAIIGILIVPRLGHLGTTPGWITFSIGAFVALVGASPTCVKKSKGHQEIPKESLEQFDKPKELLEQFHKLKVESPVWIGAERKALTIGKCVGRGGAKQALEISEDEVLMLPSANHGFDVWRRIVDEQVRISDELIELGILTVQSKRVDLYLSKDSDQPLPAYTRSSFKGLAKKGMYVIDSKKPESSCWKAKSYFKGDENRSAVESWLPIVKPLLQDIYTLAKNNAFFGSDSLNIVIIENEQGYTARYFGFDFSSKHVALGHTYGQGENNVMDKAVIMNKAVIIF